MSGFSLDSLSAGQVLGFSANPRTTDNFDTEKHLPNPSTNTSNYYTSQAWETTITNASNAYHPVKQPRNANRVQTLLQPARQPSQATEDQPSNQTPEGRPQSQIFISALPLTYPFQSQCTITFQAGTFLKICHNLQFRD